MRRGLCLLLAALTVAGCGEQRKVAADVAHADPPRGFRRSTVDGVSFSRPVNWKDVAPAPPLSGGVRSKTATVAVWRYPRVEPLPADAAALTRAKNALQDRILQRNPTFTIITSEVRRLAGGRAVELTGSQTVAGFTVDVRSAHVFRRGAEIVVDAYAPPGDFERVDNTVFVPLIESLRVR